MGFVDSGLQPQDGETFQNRFRGQRGFIFLPVFLPQKHSEDHPLNFLWAVCYFQHFVTGATKCHRGMKGSQRIAGALHAIRSHRDNTFEGVEKRSAHGNVRDEIS
jgi:hypothetical protein